MNKNFLVFIETIWDTPVESHTIGYFCFEGAEIFIQFFSRKTAPLVWDYFFKHQMNKGIVLASEANPWYKELKDIYFG